MMKWQVSSPLVYSSSFTTDTSTSCASDSDATITSDHCRRFDFNRKKSTSNDRFLFDKDRIRRLQKQHNQRKRMSYPSSDLTSVSELEGFSDLEKVSDRKLLFKDTLVDDLFNPKHRDRVDSPTSSISSPMSRRNIYTTLNGAMEELKQWISFLTKIDAPVQDVFDWLKDGTVFRKFVFNLASKHRHKRLRKLRRNLSRKHTDDVVSFLNVCKKFNLSDAQLFHPFDWHYVINHKKNTRAQEVGWLVRAKKIISTFALLAITLKKNHKYESHVGNCTVKYMREMISDLRPVQYLSTSESIQSSPRPTPLLRPPSCLYDSDTSYRKHKKVTFKENVQQRVCSVENKAKPYFSSPPNNASPPPKAKQNILLKVNKKIEKLKARNILKRREYEDYVAMKKNTNSNSDPSIKRSSSHQKVDRLTALKIDNAPRSEILPRKYKPTDKNNNSTISNADGNSRSLESFTSTLPRSRSRDRTHEDYLTSNHQSETSLYSPVSYITRTQSKKSNTLTKRFSAPQTKQKNSTLPKHSPLLRKAASFINRASPVREKKPPPKLSSNISEEKLNTKSILEPHQISLSQGHKSPLQLSDENKMNTLTRAEITDLNDLLSMFDEKEKIDTSNAIDSSELDLPDNVDTVNSYVENSKQVRNSQKTTSVPPYNTKLTQTKILHEEPHAVRRRIHSSAAHPPFHHSSAPHSQLQKNDEEHHLNDTRCDKNHSRKTNDNVEQELDYLQDVVSELLAIGSVNVNTTEKITATNKCDNQQTNKSNITRSVGSIENFFDDIENEQANNCRVLNEVSTNQSSEESDSNHNEVFSTEGNDSGIDETMPGITKDSGHKHGSKSGKHRKHHEEEKTKQKKHEHKKYDVKRSQSDSKQSRKQLNKNDSNTKNDITIKIDGLDYNSNNIGRHGRSNEQNSERDVSPRSTDQHPKNNYHSRKSEPVVRNKIRNENNNSEGDVIGSYRRSFTDSHIQRHPRQESRSKSPEKKETAGKSSSNNRNDKHAHRHSDDFKKRNSTELRRNDLIHLSSKSNEYTWDTADGKHRVYVQSKDEDPGPLPKKESVKEYDNNIRSMVRGKHTESELIGELGVTPDIIKLLKEEEKFWERQQELREWRKARDKEVSQRRDPPPSYKHHETKALPRETMKDLHRRSTGHEYDAEILREAEENRMALKAQKLMKVRAEQEHILKTSRENLLEDTVERPRLAQQNRFSSGSHSSPTEKYSPQTHNNTFNENNAEYRARQSDASPSSPQMISRNTDSGYIRSYSAGNSDRAKLSKANSRSSSSHEFKQQQYEYIKFAPSKGDCFSDDDDVFNNNKHQSPNDVDHRGYFSDDGFRDNTVSKTYLARPMYRQQRNLLRCTACVKLISDQRLVYVDGQNFYWHAACFKCVVCKALLNDSSPIRVRIVNYNLHCRFCYSARNGEQLSEV